MCSEKTGSYQQIVTLNTDGTGKTDLMIFSEISVIKKPKSRPCPLGGADLDFDMMDFAFRFLAI